MRVVHLIPNEFGKGGVFGGAERYAFELARHMADIVDTTVIAFGAESEVRKEGNLQIEVSSNAWKVRGQPSNPFSLRVLRSLRRFDVIHCHQQHILMSSSAAILCRLLGKKVFVTDLGGGGWDLSAYLSTDWLYHGHLHISQYSRRVFGHKERPDAHVILGGVDGRLFCDGGENVCRDRVVFVGRILPHKGIEYLIEGVPKGVRLEVIGKIYDDQYFKKLKVLASGKNVRFRHDCDDDGIIEQYRMAFCIVLPSVYRTADGAWSEVPELLGQTLLEGMACGAPGIATSVASLPEVVEDGVSGLIVPPNDSGALSEAICFLRDNPGRVQAMGQKAKARVGSLFCWRTVVQRCLDIYER